MKTLRLLVLAALVGTALGACQVDSVDVSNVWSRNMIFFFVVAARRGYRGWHAWTGCAGVSRPCAPCCMACGCVDPRQRACATRADDSTGPCQRPITEF